MEMILGAYLPLPSAMLKIGEVTVLNREIVKFEEHENAQVFDKKISLHQRSGYTIYFMDKYDMHGEYFDVKVTTDNGFIFYSQVTIPQEFKLNWAFKKYWIQQFENVKWLVATVMAIASAIIAYLIYTTRI
jgi:hypothetical protein